MARSSILTLARNYPTPPNLSISSITNNPIVAFLLPIILFSLHTLVAFILYLVTLYPYPSTTSETRSSTPESLDPNDIPAAIYVPTEESRRHERLCLDAAIRDAEFTLWVLENEEELNATHPKRSVWDY
ncbi:hypothetical protein BV22DRAFT_1135895 [Leucogyrophana mollusca]|uniref:Uncharacterized protein n=1 Tax=Leucogyrophana mollusca TaxID=85980 RepID=A0ACB8AU22_9AGAM|nr:hypothetical protein BV22DRAFT_1135895 [Leucogyrophana mollusca]